MKKMGPSKGKQHSRPGSKQVRDPTCKWEVSDSSNIYFNYTELMIANL